MRLLIIVFFLVGSPYLNAQDGLVVGGQYNGSYQSPVNKLDMNVGYKWWFIQPSMIYSLEYNSEGRNDNLHSLGLRADLYFQKRPWGIRPFARIELTTQMHAYKQNQMIEDDFKDGLIWRTQSWKVSPNSPYKERYFFSREDYSFMASVGAEVRIKNTLLQLGIGIWNIKYSYYIWTYHFDSSGNVVLDNRFNKIQEYRDMFMLQLGITQVIPFQKKQKSDSN